MEGYSCWYEQKSISCVAPSSSTFIAVDPTYKAIVFVQCKWKQLISYPDMLTISAWKVHPTSSGMTFNLRTIQSRSTVLHYWWNFSTPFSKHFLPTRCIFDTSPAWQQRFSPSVLGLSLFPSMIRRGGRRLEATELSCQLPTFSAPIIPLLFVAYVLVQFNMV